MVDPYTYTKLIYKRGTDVEVYEGINLENNQRIAIKLLYFDDINDANEKLKEVNNLYQFLHMPGVSKIYQSVISQTEGRYFLRIVMDYYMNGDLKKYIELRKRNKSPFKELELSQFLKQTIKVFSTFQKHGISHRDIKPENIFVSDDSTNLIIGDLGCADKKKDKSQTLAGTPLYLSPKLREAYVKYMLGTKFELKHDTFKSDVYSLGLTFLYMASFEESSSIVNSAQENMQAETDSRINSLGLSQKFKTILASMLKIDENERIDFVGLENYLMKCGFCADLVNDDDKLLDGKNICKKCVSECEIFLRKKEELKNKLLSFNQYSDYQNLCDLCLHQHETIKSCMDFNYELWVSGQNQLQLLKCQTCDNQAYLAGNWVKCFDGKKYLFEHFFCIVCTNKQGHDHSKCVSLLRAVDSLNALFK